MNQIFSALLKLALREFSAEILSPETIQKVLKFALEKARAVAEETDPIWDDIALGVIESIITSYSQAEIISEWLKDKILPNRVGHIKSSRQTGADLIVNLPPQTAGRAELMSKCESLLDQIYYAFAYRHALAEVTGG